MKKFAYNFYNEIENPTLVLSTAWQHHYGNLEGYATGINTIFNMSSYDEISFDVYKTVDGVECNLWDYIVDFKYLYIPEYQEYFSITVTIDETDNTIKHITGKSIDAVELGNRVIRDLHINDETDINYTPKYVVRDGEAVLSDSNGVVDFAYDMDENDLLNGQTELIKATVLYRPILPTDSEMLAKKKRRASLLHRVLADKCPDWSIGEVAETLAGIQRTYTVSGQNVYDFLMNTVAKEIDCLFVYGTVDKTISVYDLLNTCQICGKRGDFIDVCSKCGGTAITQGYGKNTGIFLSTDNYAQQINVTGDTDNVKNCLRLTAGDDLMTAMVRLINPNGSQYLYQFSEQMLADMPTELVNKIIEYNDLYDSKQTEYDENVDGYTTAVSEVLNLESKMMPETPIPGETTAVEQLAILEECFTIAPKDSVSVDDIEKASKTTICNAVKGYAKVLVDPRYTVSIDNDNCSINKINKTWTGKFTVTSLGASDDDEEKDEATSENDITISINEDFESFLKQKIDKSLDRTDYGLTTLFDIEDDNEFKTELTKYCKDRLSSFESTYQAILEILVNQNIKNTDVYGAELYEKMYVPYYKRHGYIVDELAIRESAVNDKIAERDGYLSEINKIHNELDFRKYIGEELYLIFCSYMKEGEYNNSNYISTGLSELEITDKAKEFLEVAKDEIRRSCEIQITISETLNNLLNTKEFAAYKDKFEMGDWIITSVNEELYRLRLITVQLDYDSIAQISFTFSNVDRVKSLSDDVESILSKAQSISNTYNFVAHQASQGDEANQVITEINEDGLNTKNTKVYAGADNGVVIDEHGILCTEYDDLKGELSPEQLKLMYNSIQFTNDNWETVKTGIGKIKYTLDGVEYERYGVNAETLISGLMVAGKIYSQNYSSVSNQGSYINLDTGDFSFGNGGLVFQNNILNFKGTINWEDTDAPDVTHISGLTDALATKQNKLIAGENIVIDEDTNVISATASGNVEDVYVNGESVLDENNIAQIPSYKEVTQSEYDSLPDSKYTDGIMYCIKDSQSSAGGALYGTEIPTADQGEDGNIYALYNETAQVVVTLYVKILGVWMPLNVGSGGGSYIAPVVPTVTTTTTSTHTVTAEVTEGS